MMANEYQLPFTAEEIAHKLQITQDEGCGWIEQTIVETMPATVVQGEPGGYEGNDFYIPYPSVNHGGQRCAYLNDSKYKLVYDDYYGLFEWHHESGPDCFHVYDIPHNGYATWNTGYGSAPKSITVRWEEVLETIHHLNEKFLPEDYKGIPQKVEALSGGNYVALPKGEYEFNVSDGSDEGYASLDWDKSAAEYMALGKKLLVHVDGTDYLSTMKIEGFLGETLCVGNPHIFDWSFEDTGEPFLIYQNNYGEFVTVIKSVSNTHIFGVSIPGATAPMSNVVDLDAFGIGEVVMSLFNIGGGSTSFNNSMTKIFWSTIDGILAGKEVRLQLRAEPWTVDVGGVTRSWVDKQCALVSFGFLVALDKVYDVKVSISRDASDCLIAVKVT